jgi:hypothetical protein
MIVSGIVLASTFAAYRIVQKQTADYSVHARKELELSFFASQFSADFYSECRLMRRNEFEFSLVQKKRLLNFTISAHYMLRTDAGHTDTFHVAVKSVEFFREGERLEENESPADEIRFRFDRGDATIESDYCKKSPAIEAIGRDEQKLEEELN